MAPDIYSINNMIGALANTPKWKEARQAQRKWAENTWENLWKVGEFCWGADFFGNADPRFPQRMSLIPGVEISCIFCLDMNTIYCVADESAIAAADITPAGCILDRLQIYY